VDHKILIISSDTSLLTSTKQFLVTQNYQILTFMDGIDAMVGVVNHRPNLILIDTSLPRLNAHQFCYLVKRNIEFRSIPVIILSHTNGLAERAKGHAVGSIYHLVLPINNQELIMVIKRFMLCDGNDK